MTAFARVTSIHVSRPQLYRARCAAEQAGKRADQNAIETLIDLAMWPLAAGGLATAVGFPALLGGVTCTSLTTNRKGIQR